MGDFILNKNRPAKRERNHEKPEYDLPLHLTDSAIPELGSVTVLSFAHTYTVFCHPLYPLAGVFSLSYMKPRQAADRPDIPRTRLAMTGP